ncbi:hypothetical protein Pth03_60910 [Planotetraspora thailandica]|uniref:Bacterial Pleckstrin homology domain-containing protein n=1 Tax=Planotetraspora thailandica TaxID=487172 RepID=A0A8J3V8Z5_9ACTN|nr:PH domain-containing protein [Planotetraspora thailandica]GII57702.1 hypothetical protein Pth03_60910 [Planotetraspora thailandica]
MPPERFTPRPSRGYLSLAVVAATVCFAAAKSVTGETRAEFVAGLVLAVASAYLMVLALCFPLMRYVTSPTTLTAQYGPLLRYRIRLSDITSVTRTAHLSAGSAASLALPGIALYGMRCTDVGRIRMCATHPSNNVLVITTRNGAHYGVTPADERAFLNTLRRHGVPVRRPSSP